MKQFDSKHAAYHVLVALYFLWLLVNGTLITLSLINIFSPGNPALTKVFLIWILLNLLMGTILFIVIRLFKNRNVINKIIIYSYAVIVFSALTTVILANLSL